jgi:hypothetical protein
MKTYLAAFIFAISIILAAFAAFAGKSTATLIGTYGDWKAYHFLEKKKKVCFMMSRPHKQEGKFTKRGEVIFYVTRWPGGATGINTVNLSNGYSFKRKNDATLILDDRNFTLFTQGEKAWTRDQTSDDGIIGKLQTASSMTVQGTSQRNTLTTDTYSLRGAAEAWQAILSTCQ